MDAHFSEYLAAVAGMQDTYGVSCDCLATEFHDMAVPPCSQTAVSAELQPACTVVS